MMYRSFLTVCYAAHLIEDDKLEHSPSIDMLCICSGSIYTFVTLSGYIV